MLQCTCAAHQTIQHLKQLRLNPDANPNCQLAWLQVTPYNEYLSKAPPQPPWPSHPGMACCHKHITTHPQMVPSCSHNDLPTLSTSLLHRRCGPIGLGMPGMAFPQAPSSPRPPVPTFVTHIYSCTPAFGPRPAPPHSLKLKRPGWKLCSAPSIIHSALASTIPIYRRLM